MGIAVGLAILLGCVFGTYVVHGGSIGIVLEAAPFELIMIMGAALGAFVVANGIAGLKHLAHELVRAAKGPAKKQADYVELLSLLFSLTRIARTKGLLALEAHVEAPDASEVFERHPGVLADRFAVDLICDSLRLVLLGLDDAVALEDTMLARLATAKRETMHVPHALQVMADGLPALGIVAAVLGVIKTMASIDQPPSILGAMIGSALVGTFLGVFLSYGVFGPLAALLGQIHEQDGHYHVAVKDVLVSHVRGLAPQIAVETARGGLPAALRPGFAEVEAALAATRGGG